MDIIELLSTYSKATLQVMARSLGLTTAPKERVQLIIQISRAMSDQTNVLHTLERLSSSERALLERVQLAGGEMSVGALRVLATRDGLTDRQGRPPTGRVAPVANSRVFEEQIARLVAHGMLLTTGQRLYGGLLGYELLAQLVIPPPVLPLLPPLPVVAEELSASPPPTIRAADPATLQRDLYLYWSFLRDTHVTLTVRGLVNKAQLKKINSLLSTSEALENVRDESEAGRLRFLRHLLVGCGLVSRSGDRLAVTPKGESFFAQPLATRTQAVFDAYLKGSFWDELMQIPCLVIEGRRTSQNEAPPFVVRGRAKLVELIAELPSEGWLDVAAIIERVRRRGYEFLLPRRATHYGYTAVPPNPYVGYGNELGWSFYAARPGQASYEGYIRDEAAGWDVVEAGMVVALLEEPLYWLGLLDGGFAPDADAPGGQRLVAIRPTPLGAHILMGAPLERDEPLPSGRLIVQPTFQLLAYPPVSEVQLALLDRIAERGRLEQVAEYRLTRESVYRARQQHGLTVDQVVASLERESGTALPQNVAYTLVEWGQAQERVVLHEEVTLLTVAEPGQLDRLLAAPGTAAAIARRLTPTAALVHLGSLATIEAALLADGQLPLRFDQPPDLETGGHWLEVAADGLLTLLPSAPALYLRRALRPFSGEQGAALRITPAGVRQALADGLVLEQLLDRLAAWSGGNLPHSLQTQIKAWGGFFGSAQIERPVLLRLEDGRVLQSLLEDPELAPLLRPYQPSGALVEIDQQQLGQIAGLLAARGMHLDGAPPPAAHVPPADEEPSAAEEPPRRRGRPRKTA